MRLCVVITAVCLCVVGLSLAEDVHASIRKQTNIPAEGLGPALQTLAKERNFQIVFVSEEVNALHTQGAIGEFTPEEALKQLLKGTGLTYRFFGENAISIIPVTSASSPSTSTVDTQPSSRSNENSNEKEGTKSNSFWLAQANRGVAQSSSTIGSDVRSTSGSSEKTPGLEEILVTAQKRTERQQDVPIAMTVLDPQTLADNGQSRLQDYFATVPGLSLSSSAFMGGTNYVTIRGLSAGFSQNPTVATVIDDVPVGSSQILAFGNLTSPDLDPSDLARIEVLKGPQGTLYGADSLGGLIKYVTADPSTSTFSGRAEATGMDITGGGAGYAVRAAANIPLSDVLAVRVSGFARRDPGYIDNLTTGQSNINSADVYGGHFSALYRPSENLSLKLNALIQNTNGNGNPYVNSDGMGHFLQGDLNQTGLPGTNSWYTRWQLYTATLNAKVAGLDITSVTGYGTNTLDNFQDLTNCCSAFSQEANKFFPGSTGVPYYSHFHSEKVSQEIRLTSSVQKWFDWLAGAFYSHERSPDAMNQLDAANPTTGALAGVLSTYNYSPVPFSEYALFGDLTFHLTDRFDVQVGGRQSWDRTVYAPVYFGPAIPDLNGVPSPEVGSTERSSGSPFTYLVTPKFTISPDLQVYARFASGYRIGGPNFDAGSGGIYKGIPSEYKPDKTTNYEFGVKGDAFEHHLSFEAAAYYISWKDFQLGVTNTYLVSYTTNAGDAKSEGLELSVEARPLEGLTLAVQGSFNNAVLTQDLPQAAVNNGTYGAAGDRLPYSIRTSGGLTANQDIRLSNDWVGFIGGAVNYVGSRPLEFTYAPPPTATRASAPAYTQFNLRTGVRYQSWLVNLYVNNVADRRGVIGFFGFAPAIGNTGGSYTVVTQPRTVGLNVAKTFGYGR